MKDKHTQDLEEESCGCCDECNCGDDCQCTEDNKCSEECTCGEHQCNCNKEHKCECENCHCDDNEAECECGSDCDCHEKNYLADLQRVQAEFDNYRKRMVTALGDARQDGFMDAIEQFLPALDSFKMATDMITDKNTLVGIKFIEKGILDTLAKMGVEQVDATGEFNPELHQAVDTDNTADVETGYIVKEMFKGFTYKGKVIRYSQVVVKK
ncbi:MAG: nucleotide exchange factor GrpE [Clostridia bacterium]|nr:nucleotide exchange factor GrpE [Clostridia bacterium]